MPLPKTIPWRDLSPERQAELQEAYGRETARQTTTCAMDEKIARFAAWLAPQAISFSEEDLPRRRR